MYSYHFLYRELTFFAAHRREHLSAALTGWGVSYAPVRLRLTECSREQNKFDVFKHALSSAQCIVAHHHCQPFL